MNRLGERLAGWTPSWLQRRLFLLAANRARDRGAFADAARLYDRVLRFQPGRVGVRVQKANMLKDSGRFAEAEAEYLTALTQRPDDADIQLQLGHLCKVLGRRGEAIARYRRADEISPGAPQAVIELALLGDEESLNRRFEAALGGPDVLPAPANDPIRTRLWLEAALQSSPELASELAFPCSQYDAFRQVWAPPAPPDGRAEPALVLVAMDGVSPAGLKRLAGALRAQSAPDWRVLFVGAEPARCDWARGLAATDDRLEVFEGAASLGELVRRARHDLIVVPAPEAALDPHALAWFGWAAAHTPAAAFVCDQEHRRSDDPGAVIDDSVLRWVVDHEILLQANPYGQTLAFDRRRLAPDWCGDASDLASAVLSLLLEFAADGAVGHIPYPLTYFAGRMAARDHGPAAHDYAGVVLEHLGRRGQLGQADVHPCERAIGPGAQVVWRSPEDVIHVVTPTRDNGEDVRGLVRSLKSRSARWDAVRVTIVDNGSIDAATLQILAELKGEGVDVQRCDEPFNWSRLSNLGAQRAESEIVLFANDDMVMLSDGWDDRLRGLLRRPEVGIVGAKLVYPDDTIQHAGILFGWRGRAIHDGVHEDRTAAGPGGRWQLRRRVSAVTGAFLAIRRREFEALGGFDEQRLTVAYSDLDIALKVRERGLAVLYAPEIELTHYESKSRGLTHLTAAAAARDEAELAVMRSRWPGVLDWDPSVHPAWLDETLPFRLLRVPGADAVLRRLEATALADPWRPSAGGA